MDRGADKANSAIERSVAEKAAAQMNEIVPPMISIENLVY
jgi:hypothetical protein